MLTNTLAGPSSRCRVNHMPLAVPRWLGSTVQASGRSAWARFTSNTLRPSLLKMATMRSSTSGWRTSRVPKNSQRASLVMSSLVGPSPPVISTRSPESSSNVRRMVARSSPMVRTSTGRMPCRLSCPPIQAALVFTVCPISSSSPMLRMLAVISLDIRGCGNVKMWECENGGRVSRAWWVPCRSGPRPPLRRPGTPASGCPRPRGRRTSGRSRGRWCSGRPRWP